MHLKHCSTDVLRLVIIHP